MAKKKESFDVEDITALDVLGMFARRMKEPKSAPPCLLCMSDEARATNRALGSSMLDEYKSHEAELKKLRAAGNPRAFFLE